MNHSHFTKAFLFGVAVTTSLLAAAQANMSEVLRGTTPLTFIGLDFSAARFTARYDFAELDQQGANYFMRWNGLMEAEWAKFNMAEPMKLVDAPTKTLYVQEINAAVDLSKAWGNGGTAFDLSRIPAMVERYATEDGEGVGCVFIVAEFNKGALMGDFYVVFFDMKSKAVLHTEHIIGKPMGFGLRNYWAGAVYDALKQVKSTYRRLWEQKYLKK